MLEPPLNTHLQVPRLGKPQLLFLREPALQFWSSRAATAEGYPLEPGWNRAGTHGTLHPLKTLEAPQATARRARRDHKPPQPSGVASRAVSAWCIRVPWASIAGISRVGARPPRPRTPIPRVGDASGPRPSLAGVQPASRPPAGRAAPPLSRLRVRCTTSRIDKGAHPALLNLAVTHQHHQQHHQHRHSHHPIQPLNTTPGPTYRDWLASQVF